MKKLSTVLICLLIFSSSLLAQNEIVGQWKTIDDNSGKARSIVEIYKSNGKYQGKIIQLFRDAGEEQDPVCTECSGSDKSKKIIGLQIIKDLEYDDEEWDDGTILDPENGKTYDCKLWIEDGELKVRGYVAFFYRTQTWKKYK